jgi:hypothetical protein
MKSYLNQPNMNRKQRREYERSLRKRTGKSNQMNSILCSSVLDIRDDTIQTILVNPEINLNNLSNQVITKEEIGVVNMKDDPEFYVVFVYHIGDRIIKEDEITEETEIVVSNIFNKQMEVTGGEFDKPLIVSHHVEKINRDIQSFDDVISMIEGTSNELYNQWQEYLSSQLEAA